MKKIVVSADSNGCLDFLLKKVSALHAKNQFDFMLCLGRVMPLEECEIFSQLKSGKLKLPIPVYFIESGDMAGTLGTLFPHGKEVLPNLFFLGRAGVKTICETNVAFLNGRQNDLHANFYLEHNVEYSAGFYTIDDIDSLCQSKLSDQPIDILLTNEWPQDSTANPPKPPQNASSYVSRITERLSPRYHFAGSEGMYFKRKEYLNRKGYATSFISVAPIIKDGDNKEKYLHAIQIVPLKELGKEALAATADGLDNNPFEFLESAKVTNIPISALKPSTTKPIVKTDFKESPIIYFQRFSDSTHESEIQEFVQRWGQTIRFEIFFDEGKRRHKGSGIVVFKDVEIAKKCLAESGQYSLHGSRIRFLIRSDQNQYTDKNCWFCKESDVFDETLVFHYGRQCYLALDKGPITPQHFQLVPIKHLTNHPSLDEPTKVQLFTVYNRLRNYFLANSKDIVSFERYLNLSHSVNHYIRQCVPIDVSQCQNLANLFEKKCLQERLNFLKVQEVQFDDHTKGKFYYRLQFGETIYVCIVKDRHFPIDFGRSTVCELLNLTQRVNWKSCVNESKSKQQLNRYTAIMREVHLAE